MRSRRSLSLLVLLGLLSVMGLAPASAGSTVFEDTAGTRYGSAVETLAAEGIVQGCGGDRFCVDRPLTRGQFASILVNLLAWSDHQLAAAGEVSTPRFADSESSVHGPALELLADAGFISGCTGELVCPDEPLSRGQLASLAVAVFDLPEAPDDRTIFRDGGATHGASADALGAAGVSEGCGPLDFCPHRDVSRGEAALYLARAAELEPRVTLAPYGERREAQRQAELEARGQRAVDVALAQLGKPYGWGAAGPHRFDCSGLVFYSWQQANGVRLPRSSRDMHRALAPISRDELIPGDLVFYHQPVSHVAMYIGDGRVVDAPGRGRHVQIRSDGLTRRGVVGYARPGFNR